MRTQYGFRSIGGYVKMHDTILKRPCHGERSFGFATNDEINKNNELHGFTQ